MKVVILKEELKKVVVSFRSPKDSKEIEFFSHETFGFIFRGF